MVLNHRFNLSSTISSPFQKPLHPQKQWEILHLTDELITFFPKMLNKIVNMTLTASFPASIRLFNGTNRCSGRVEVSQGGQWGKICNINWGEQESTKLCKELGCGPPKTSQENFHFGDTRLKGYRTTCAQNASSISDCTFQEITETCEGVSLSCTGKTV